MQRKVSLFAVVLVLTVGVAATVSSFAARGTARGGASEKNHTQLYDVTITNVTRGQQLTPILVVTHKRGVSLFRPGSPPSAELEILAESGDTGPLMALLQTLRGVKDVNISPGLLNPGESATVTVEAGGPFRYISAAAMLIPTNDAFFALNGVPLPGRFKVASFSSPGYDAGSEINDELCASIPGPEFIECDGPGSGGAPDGGEEGFVHIHAGIHGIGDMDAAERDWRNPVVRVRVKLADGGDPDDGDDDDDDF